VLGIDVELVEFHFLFGRSVRRESDQPIVFERAQVSDALRHFPPQHVEVIQLAQHVIDLLVGNDTWIMRPPDNFRQAGNITNVLRIGWHNVHTASIHRRMRLLAFLILSGALGMASERPNILWITSEDNGPHLGCYGDAYAKTPNLDRLAMKGMIYLNVWSVAPVCAPARTALISGLYPSSTGSEHMRSMVKLPAHMKMFPQFLREAGYYCSNNSKEDYNLEKPGKVWDESSNKAHWKHRAPGQPFFAVFNHTVTHESQIRSRPHQLQHDPAKVRLPRFHPDTLEVRQDWAQYYDKMTEMDALAGANLRELEEAGLAEDTIIFYFGDHGPGLPRCKRSPYNSGLRVPLIIYAPKKFRHLIPQYRAGEESERLMSFVDFAPIVLTLAGVKPPEWMQGVPLNAPAPKYLHGLRGRMDERYDLIRTVRDKRYVYVRNYMPHKIPGQHIAYMFETPTTRAWQRTYLLGQGQPETFAFWEKKPIEELYDLKNDPDEVHNLTRSTRHQKILAQMRMAQRAHVLTIRDIGFLPEGEMHSRSSNSTPYEVAQSDRQYPLARVLAAADWAASTNATPAADFLNDADSAVRFWGVMGLLIRGVKTGPALERALSDPSPYVRITAAEALRRAAPLVALSSADDNGLYVALWALNALDSLRGEAVGIMSPREKYPLRLAEYVPRLIESLQTRR
jgi:arylsulfatase A-like enzyme